MKNHIHKQIRETQRVMLVMPADCGLLACVEG